MPARFAVFEAYVAGATEMSCGCRGDGFGTVPATTEEITVVQTGLSGLGATATNPYQYQPQYNLLRVELSLAERRRQQWLAGFSWAASMLRSRVRVSAHTNSVLRSATNLAPTYTQTSAPGVPYTPTPTLPATGREAYTLGVMGCIDAVRRAIQSEGDYPTFSAFLQASLVIYGNLQSRMDALNAGTLRGLPGGR